MAGNMIEAMAGTHGSGGSVATTGPTLLDPGKTRCILRISGEPTGNDAFGYCLSAKYPPLGSMVRRADANQEFVQVPGQSGPVKFEFALTATYGVRRV